jgi:predicted AAA+ superfamily ATPase
MELSILNSKLRAGSSIDPQDLPSLAGLRSQKNAFDVEFGLANLPLEPGLIVVRGARQYGKSTWLESELHKSYTAYGPASCFHINGDDIENEHELFECCSKLISLMGQSPAKRLFIDEITAVANWQTAIKRLWDKGFSRDTLIVTTGSHAEDLLTGAELLPGRKGKLARTNFIFTPVSFASFSKVTQLPAQDRVALYLISGGSPLACNSLLEHGILEPYILQLVRDWILGNIARSGRTRASALGVLRELLDRGGSPVSMTKVAKEAGLANNSVALGYTDLFVSSLFLHRSWPFDFIKKKTISRKESKFHFINLLGAIAFSTQRLHSLSDWTTLSQPTQGKWIEWLVAQELWRRSVIATDNLEETIPFLSVNNREVDFLYNNTAYEVKRGAASPDEFLWFRQAFPKAYLVVICSTPFETAWCRGVTLEDFLLGKA